MVLLAFIAGAIVFGSGILIGAVIVQMSKKDV